MFLYDQIRLSAAALTRADSKIRETRRVTLKEMEKTYQEAHSEIETANDHLRRALRKIEEVKKEINDAEKIKREKEIEMEEKL